MPETPPIDEKPVTARTLAASKRAEKLAAGAAALRQVKADERAAGAARALERERKRQENREKHRLEQEARRRKTDSPDNAELLNAVALRHAQGRDLLAACQEVYGEETAEDTATRLQSDGRFTRLVARYKAYHGRTDDEVKSDLESFYYSLMHDPEADPKNRLAAAKQLQQLRNLEQQKVAVSTDPAAAFILEQLALTAQQPPAWQQNAIDVATTPH